MDAAVTSSGSGSAGPPATYAAPPGFMRLTKQEKRTQKAQKAHDKKMQWRERAKGRRHAKTEQNRVEREARLAAMSEAERAAFDLTDKADRDRLYAEKVAQTGRIDAALAGGLRVALDLSYHDLMTAREQESLSRQISRCWGANRRARAPVSLQLAGVANCPASCLPRDGVHLKWKVRLHEDDVSAAFDPSELVFLSPDADEALGELDPSKVYVIGGLVDGTVIKRTTLAKAEALGAKAVRLPLAEYAPGELASGRLPLTLPAVLEMLLLLNGGGGWAEAVSGAVAPRLQRARTKENSKGHRRADSNAARTATWNANAGGGGGGGGGGSSSAAAGAAELESESEDEDSDAEGEDEGSDGAAE